jgi:hypothetical protein
MTTKRISPARGGADRTGKVNTSVPQGRAYAGPPCRGRSLWCVTVLSCPLCGGMHQHRAGNARTLLSGKAMRSCPTTGKPYLLAPVQRRREARRVR